MDLKSFIGKLVAATDNKGRTIVDYVVADPSGVSYKVKIADFVYYVDGVRDCTPNNGDNNLAAVEEIPTESSQKAGPIDLDDFVNKDVVVTYENGTSATGKVSRYNVSPYPYSIDNKCYTRAGYYFDCCSSYEHNIVAIRLASPPEPAPAAPASAINLEDYVDCLVDIKLANGLHPRGRLTKDTKRTVYPYEFQSETYTHDGFVYADRCRNERNIVSIRKVEGPVAKPFNLLDFVDMNVRATFANGRTVTGKLTRNKIHPAWPLMLCGRMYRFDGQLYGCTSHPYNIVSIERAPEPAPVVPAVNLECAVGATIKVRLRSGATLTRELTRSGAQSHPYKFNDLTYKRNGSYYHGNTSSAYDIMAVEDVLKRPEPAAPAVDLEDFVGETIKTRFRDGATSTGKLNRYRDPDHPYILNGYSYKRNGSYYNSGLFSPKDIMAIEDVLTGSKPEGAPSVNLEDFVNKTVKVRMHNGAPMTGKLLRHPASDHLYRMCGNTYKRNGSYYNYQLPNARDIMAIECVAPEPEPCAPSFKLIDFVDKPVVVTLRDKRVLCGTLRKQRAFMYPYVLNGHTFMGNGSYYGTSVSHSCDISDIRVDTQASPEPCPCLAEPPAVQTEGHINLDLYLGRKVVAKRRGGYTYEATVELNQNAVKSGHFDPYEVGATRYKRDGRYYNGGTSVNDLVEVRLVDCCEASPPSTDCCTAAPTSKLDLSTYVSAFVKVTLRDGRTRYGKVLRDSCNPEMPIRVGGFIYTLQGGFNATNAESPYDIVHVVRYVSALAMLNGQRVEAKLRDGTVVIGVLSRIDSCASFPYRLCQLFYKASGRYSSPCVGHNADIVQIRPRPEGVSIFADFIPLG